MPVLKPIRAIQLHKNHPLTRGLVGCWLCNENNGDKLLDSSGNHNNASLYNTSWLASKFGGGPYYNGISAYANIGQPPSLDVDYITIATWVRYDAQPGAPTIIGRDEYPGSIRVFAFYNYGSSTLRFFVFVGGNAKIKDTAFVPTVGQWYHLVGVADGENVRIYIDSKDVGSPTSYSGVMDKDAVDMRIGDDLNDSHGPFKGIIDHLMIWNRALTAAEIAHLYREPFCMFERVMNSSVLFVPITNLAGVTSAQSATSTTLKRVRCIKGSLAATADVNALLKIIDEVLLTGSAETSSVLSGKLTLSYRGPWLKSPLKVERQWLTDALFNGMTTNAFKLGTALSGGWFWMRPSGCTAIYRGTAMDKIDFINVLSVAEQKTESMPLSDYTPQNNSSTYFYVVRRFNNCGYQERTLQAAVKIEIDTEGNLAEPLPNHIFAWRANQMDGNKVQLIWFYSPLEQMSKPVHFKVYYDGGTGQINYENPIATIGYQGRKFYCWQSEALPGNKYLFTVKAEDINGIENNSLEQLAIDIVGDGPDEIEILKIETL